MSSTSSRLPTTQSPTSTPLHLVPSLLPRINTTTTLREDTDAMAATMTTMQQGPLSATSTSSTATVGDGTRHRSSQEEAPLARLDSNSSISSSSKTANFFASSPIMTPTPPKSHPPPALHLNLGGGGGTSSSSASEDYDTAARQSSFLTLGLANRHSRNDSSSSSTSSLSPFSGGGGAASGGLKSASSVRSRRNWDEFEGKPITPLPSPNVHADMESSDSMYGESAASTTAGTTAATHSPTPSSKTKNFFGTSHTATPPSATARRPVGSSSNDNHHPSIPIAVTASPALAPSPSPSFPSWPSITSNGASSRDASPSTSNARLPDHYQRPSRFPTLPSGPGAGQQAVAATAATGAPVASATPPRQIGLGPPPPFDSNGKAATSRHVHGPSENATGSSLAPLCPTTPRPPTPAQPTTSGDDEDGTPSASPRMVPREIDDADVAADESEDEASGRVGSYRIEKTLGVGAFSRVVLASPIESGISSSSSETAPTPLPLPQKRRSLPWSRAWRRSSAIVSGAPTTTSTDSAHSGSGTSSPDPSRSPVRGLRARLMSTAAASAPSPSPQHPDPFATAPPPGALVALKMLAREPCANNERMKVSWVREVEVLKHIAHPCLIKVFHSFSTPKHHVLVLERIAGGELFDYLAAHHGVIAKREWLARRLCSELANAVGWMHSVNLVHRDIKLENIILTRALPGDSDVDAATFRPSTLGPIPLLKVTDFGLSRFIDPHKPLLETRCGSEEYASPELIIGKKYDGRKTDVWSMGVVFYAILSGMLPFGDLDEEEGENQSQKAGPPTPLPTSSREGGDMTYVDPRVRKARLLRIAKGDLRYPSRCNDDSQDVPTACPAKYRLLTPAAKQLLARLLRRDATKRANAWDIWDDDPWLLKGSFDSSSGGEQTAYGEDVEIVPDPKSEAGRAWLALRAGVKGGEVSTLAKAD